jgi:hypothetical protein
LFGDTKLLCDLHNGFDCFLTVFLFELIFLTVALFGYCFE